MTDEAKTESRDSVPPATESFKEPIDDLDWARRLVDNGEHVMHLPTRTIGKVVRFYDGQGELYRPALDKPEVKRPVLELEQGHTFIANVSSFTKLDPRQAAFYLSVQAVLKDVLIQTAKIGVSQGISGPTATTLLSVAMRAQWVELEKGLAQLRGEPANISLATPEEDGITCSTD